MFDLSIPWWQLVLRSSLLYVLLMVLLRVSGKRTIGEFTAFDLVVVLLLAEASQGALTGGDQSVLGALIVTVTLVALNYAVAFTSTRSSRFDKLVEGEPVVLIRNGVRLERALRANNVPGSDLDEAIRKAGLADQEDVRLAMLETDGEITVVPRRTTPRH